MFLLSSVVYIIVGVMLVKCCEFSIVSMCLCLVVFSVCGCVFFCGFDGLVIVVLVNVFDCVDNCFEWVW